MAKTKIEWTDYSYNPITGCTKGCKYCYARRMTERNLWGYDFTPQLHHDRLKKHRNWKPNEKVFVCDMGDMFDPQVDRQWILQVFGVFTHYPDVHFQLLTKQVERMYDYAQSYGKLPSNVWWGCTVTNQDDADIRIPTLLKLKALGAKIVYVSCEPMLGELKIKKHLTIASEGEWMNALELGKYNPKIDWVICGGESGPGARPMPEDWAWSLRDQCVYADVPFFFKQWGGINKKAAGRMLSGREWNQMPLKGDIFHDSEIAAEGFHFDNKRAEENLEWLRKQQLEDTNAP